MTAVTDTVKGKAFPIWAVIAFGGVLTSMSLGVRSTFGLFLEPVANSILDGVQGPFGLAVAIQSIVWGLSQPIAGAISDRFGAAYTFAGGAVLYAVALVLMSTAEGSAAIILSTGFLTGIAIGAASFAVVLSAVGRMVAPEKRSFALGLVSALGSLGQFVLVPLAGRLIDSLGWEDTLLVLAAIVVGSMVMIPILRGSASKNFPEARTGHEATLRQDLRRAAHHRPYLLLNGAFFVCGFHVTFIALYLPNHGADLGQAGAATTALALIGLFNFFGSLAAGWAGGRYSKTHLLALIYALRGIVITAFLLLPPSATITILFGAAMGVLWLSTVPLTSAMVTEMFGTTNSGALFGIVFVSHQVGALIGAWAGGANYDAFGNYNLIWWIGAGLGGFAMIMQLLITDQGPAPEPPEPTGRIGRLAPTGGVASWVVLIGISAALTLTDATTAAADAGEVLLGWCFG